MGITEHSPLAAKLRPKTLDDVVGQSGLTQPGSVLRQIAEPFDPSQKRSMSSVVLWGPPGSGKTSIALAIARSSNRNFVELNAVSAGVKEVREAIGLAQRELASYDRGTLLFIDEIHRFNKAQQDALLAEVEAGTFLLIAATTENPTHSVNAPLLSRCVLLELDPLSDADISEVLRNGLMSPDGLNGEVSATDDAVSSIVRLCSADARRALVLLESAANRVRSLDRIEITLEDVLAIAKSAALNYDRNGDQHYDVISAFIKSIRGSDVDASLHYLARMLESGEDPRFIARRLMISAAEDVGLADPQALVLATTAAQSVALIGMPEARIALGEATIYLALAPKSNAAYLAINEAISDVKSGISESIPTAMQNTRPAGLEADKYVYPHDDPNAVVAQDYVGAKVRRRSYFNPKPFGFEEQLIARWKALKKIIRGD